MTEPRPIYPKHFLSEPVARANTGFILMPFSDEFEPVHEAIRAAITEARLRPLRADDIFSTRSGMEKILRGIAEAEVVIADMTGRNANVFYEAGIAHTIKDNVVLLTQDINDIPFDFRHIDHIEYKNDELDGLTQDLSEVIGRLPAEPPPDGGRSAGPTSVVETKTVLRRRRDACEREWADEVVPAEASKFYDRFPALHTSPTISIPEDEWDESLRIHLPAFLPTWLPVEDLGLDVIKEGPPLQSVVPELVLALERAYTLWDRIRPQQPHTITGHGALLALRTWTLWGAVALDSENWVAVEALLHRPTNVGPDHPSLSQLPLHYPAAAGNRIDIAAGSVDDQLDPLASQHFGDLESLQAFIGLWRFAADLATRGSDQWMLQTWAVTARERFEGLVGRLAIDADYAQRFVHAVCLTGVQDLNKLWQGGLRDELTSRGRLDAGQRHWMLPRLPDRFAE